jgi:hypothetical protein
VGAFAARLALESAVAFANKPTHAVTRAVVMSVDLTAPKLFIALLLALPQAAIDNVTSDRPCDASVDRNLMINGAAHQAAVITYEKKLEILQPNAFACAYVCY